MSWFCACGAVAQDTMFRTMLFRLKVAEDTYNDETRIKVRA